MEVAKNIYLCLFDFRGSTCRSLVTDDEEYAKSLDPSYQLATIDDLHQHVAATGEIFYGLLNTYDGLCEWIEDENELEMSQYQLIKEKRLAI